MTCHNCGKEHEIRALQQQDTPCRMVRFAGTCAVEAIAWLRPCSPLHWGTPCECKEGQCEGR